jgi:hypothetical protein
MAITLDDESFGCCAKDNQVKKLNPQKADNEGYALYAIADCYFRMPLGIQFSHRGELQERNVETLIGLAFKTGASTGGTSLLGEIVDLREFPLLSLLHVMVLALCSFSQITL